MQRIVTCLGFNDRAEEAVKFYTSVFKNSRILSTTRFGESGPGPEGSVMAIAFELNGQPYLALNGGPPFTFTIGMSLMVQCGSQKDIDYYWEKLSEGGEKSVCGWLTDKFGVSWQVVPSILNEIMKDPPKADRAMKEVLQMTKIDLATLERVQAGA